MRRGTAPHAPTVYGSGGSPIATISGKKTVLEGSAGPYQTVPATAAGRPAVAVHTHTQSAR